MKFNLKEEAEKGVEEVNNNTNNNIKQENDFGAAQNGGGELEFNKKNRENYETLMTESSTQLDGYWDSKNPFVKLFLLGLLAFIVLGVIYYVMTFIGTK